MSAIILEENGFHGLKTVAVASGCIPDILVGFIDLSCFHSMMDSYSCLG